MVHRDGHQAALSRADALQRELDEAKAELDRRDEALVEAQRSLLEHAEAEAELDELRQTRAAAARRLEALRRAGQAPKQRPREPDVAALPRPLPSSRLRLLRSLLWAGPILLVPKTAWLVLFVGFFTFAGYYHSSFGGSTHLTEATLTAVLAATALPLISLLWAAVKWAAVRRWVQTRGYTLVGYPQIPAFAPPPGGAGQPGRPHKGSELQLRLTFIDEQAKDFDSVLRGFEATCQPLDEGCWRFSYPVEEGGHRRRSGAPLDNVDTNWPTHRWFLRLEREALCAIHELRALARVELTREG